MISFASSYFPKKSFAGSISSSCPYQNRSFHKIIASTDTGDL
jgi:hypothetical protein